MNILSFAKEKIGKPPGSLVYTGVNRNIPTTIDIINYKHEIHETHHNVQLNDLKKIIENDHCSWINIVGLQDIEIIRDCGDLFGINHLILEDILNTNSLPKIEFEDDLIFISLKMLTLSQGDTKVTSEQVAFVVGDFGLVSFQEAHGDLFEPLRKRIEASMGVVRKKGADYLLYALIDIIVDNYYLVIESMDQKVNIQEEVLLKDESTELLQEVLESKKTIRALRSAMAPLKEVLRKLMEENNKRINKEIHRYYRDVYDHVIYVNEELGRLADIIAGLTDLHLSNVSNRMNNIMKKLTIIATVFIPLTFLAGLYGMNFDVMPELHHPYGYPILLGVMVLVGGGFVVYLKRTIGV